MIRLENILEKEVVSELIKRGFKVQEHASIKGFDVDVVAENPETKKKCFVEIREAMPGLTSGMIGFCRVKKDNSSFFAFISPKGVSENAENIAKDCGINVFRTLNDFSVGLSTYANLNR